MSGATKGFDPQWIGEMLAMRPTFSSVVERMLSRAGVGLRRRAVGFVGAFTVFAVVQGAGSASAQESALGEAKERLRSGGADAALAYGRALRRAGRENEALAELQRGRGLAAGRAELAARFDWEAARTYIAKRDFAQAMATCRSIARLPGANAVSRVCAAEAHLLWRRGTEAKIELAELAKMKSIPADVEVAARVAEGRALELEVKEEAAEAAYRDAIRLAPERSDLRVVLGSMLVRLGHDGGLAELRKAVELEARDPVAQLELGRALPQGSPEAIAALERAAAEQPTSTEALRTLAENYILAKRIGDAKRVAATVLNRAPNDVVSHIVAGRVALAEGRADDALKEGENTSRLMPNSAQGKLLVADAWAHKKEIDLALEAYQAAFGLDRMDPTPLVNATNACIAAGRLTSARAFATRATKDFPSYGPGWLALGDALAADKEPGAARSAYESARKLVDAATVEQRLRRVQ